MKLFNNNYQRQAFKPRLVESIMILALCLAYIFYSDVAEAKPKAKPKVIKLDFTKPIQQVIEFETLVIEVKK